MESSVFPKTINVFEWCKFLNRELNNNEKELFHNVRIEKIMNMQMQKINNNIENRNLQISHLTAIDGNCLFDSLSKLNIGENSEQLRKSLTYLMIIFADYKNFFPDQQESLRELFTIFNEIEYVHCKFDSKLYKYNYDIMCQDMYESCNWTRLPTQLILMVLSKIFNLNITIINENGFEHNINIGESNSKNIYLAHIGESHYLPINYINNNQQNLEYDEYTNIFLKWAQDKANEAKKKPENTINFTELEVDDTVLQNI